VPESAEQPTPKPRDFRQEVTDNIVGLLEKGVAPWQKPWDAQSQLAMPVNPTTDRAYRGGNAIHLLAVGLQRNYEDPRWMTYKQASEQGWQVRRGEKGTQIEFWDVKTQPTAQDKQSGQSAEKLTDSEQLNVEPGQRLVHRVYTVFNARQIDGIPALSPVVRKPFEVAEAGERILKNSGAKISHDQADRAFYDRGRDAIHLPPKEAFKDAPGYYGTALHELGHWTGHPSRLDRWTLNDNYRFGDTKYAKEELRAELASVFIAAEKRIPHDPQNHAAYVGSWIQALKQDKNEIFRAAHDASKAADLLLSLERDVSIADQDLEITSPESAVSIAETSQLERDREVLAEQPAEQLASDSRAHKQTTGPFKPGDKVMAYEPYFYGGKPKPDPWTPAIVQSLYNNDQYISYARNQTENGNKAVEYAEKGDMRHASSDELSRYAAEFAKLEQKLPEALRSQTKPDGKTEPATRESTQATARHEAENGAVSVTEKQTGIERRTQINKSIQPDGQRFQDRYGESYAEQIKEAMRLTTQLAGNSANAKPAELIAGVHRGKIIGETSDFVLQRESPRSVVVHPKELFDAAPKVGANVVVNYANGTPSIREVKERGRAQGMSR
jgi:antirestriction protein ArdC